MLIESHYLLPHLRITTHYTCFQSIFEGYLTLQRSFIAYLVPWPVALTHKIRQLARRFYAESSLSRISVLSRLIEASRHFIMFTIVILALCAIPAIILYLKYRWDKEDADLGLPGPPALPLFGNSLDMRKANKEDGDRK